MQETAHLDNAGMRHLSDRILDGTREISRLPRDPARFHPLHTVTLSDTLILDEESFQDPPLLTLDAQNGFVRSCAL
jgi:hypothetical protein